jgi:Tfp pilus assembly protein PilO
MSRQAKLLAALLALAVVGLFYLFGFKPQEDRRADLQEQVAAARAEQDAARLQVAHLEGVRAEAPRIEAQIAAAEAVVPRSNALPGTLRALQMAASDSGVTLTSVAPGRPVAVEGATNGLSRLDLSVGATGSYFQLVDFLRRIEDPAITARGVVWGNGSISADQDSYPELTANVSGAMYAVLEQLEGFRPDGSAAPPPAATPTEGDEGSADADADAATTEEGGA